MKTLPDSPSLDHLRQQAKDVLLQLRTVRPDAALSEAQALLAERYGYRTWPDLKAEVDRRATAVVRAGDETTAAVAAAFDLGPPTGPMVGLGRQWAGHAWVLTTEGGRWLARELFRWFEDAALEQEALLAESASAVGIRTPLPVRSPSGRLVEIVGDARWRVYTLPAVGPEPTLPADPRHARAAGRIVGRVHAMRLPAPAPVSCWLTNVRPESKWRTLNAAAEAAGRAWADRLGEVIPVIMDACAIVEQADPNAEAVLSACHYAPNAFCVAGPDDLAVMSWEHAGAIPPRWDFGSTLAFWSEGIPGRVNAPAAKAVVAGYSSEFELPDPLDVGIFSAVLCASMSWLASRVRIALTEPDDEQRELADRAVPWLLRDLPSRARYQAVLDAVSPS
jgi:hypothetical protein